MKLFYRICKVSKHNNSKFKLIERALNRQPFVKLSTELREATSSAASKALNDENDTISSATSKRNNTKKDFVEAPRHDLKIIIAKKSSSRSSRNIGSNNKIRLNKPNGNGSKVLSDFERLRGDVDNVQFSSASSSEIVSTSEMKKTLSKKSGTVSHHDLKLENKSSNTKKQHNSASHDYYYESTMNEREKEKCYEKHSRRESTKHHAKNNEKVEKFKASKSNLSLNNIPKLKIELPSLKTKITVPKTPTDKYVISSKSPSNSPKCETPFKKVRFDISPRERERCYEFKDDADINSVDQMEYAESLGLKPVERKVESIILHRKRKKSKHSKETEHSKRPKLHVSSSLDESLKLKLKIMGGKSCKSDKKSNEDETHSREKATCNLRAFQCKTADLTSINVQEEKQQKNIREKQLKEADDVVVGLENHKYSVSEQNHKYSVSGSDQPMVFIPKLVLQKTQNASDSYDKKESPSATSNDSQRRNSFVVEQSKPNSTDANESLRLKVKSFDSVGFSEVSNQKSMKPPTAKMGSPKQSHMTTFSLSPNRPHSIPASLKLSLIARSPTPSNEFLQMQNQLKRSLSLGAEKSSPTYSSTFVKPNKNYFSSTSPDAMNIQYSKIPPLISSSTSAVRNFYGSMSNTIASHKSQSPQHASKLPNINVKDPTKLFPNACPSVEILKIPQKTFAPVENVKVNRPMPTTISLEKIRKSAQNPVAQKILPKPQLNQSAMKVTTVHQPPQCSSGQSLNYSGIYQTPINRDVSLERYTLELTHDIAKLDRSLSLEKNYEDWERKKLQEYSKLNELKNFPMMTKNLLNHQQNLSVRNIPNPSAIMMSRNQTLSSNCYKGNLNVALKAGNMSPQKVTSTNSEQSDIEDMLTKTTISKANEKQLSDFSSQKSPVSKVSDKKSIEKLTEYLRLAAKSKDIKHDDDNNNNNNSSNNCGEPTANNRNFNLQSNKSDKFLDVPSVDVICIDS